MIKNNKKGIKLIFAIFTAIIILGISANIIYAQTSKEKQSYVFEKFDINNLQYTPDYQKWLELPEEEKAKYIQPNPYGTPYEPNTQNSMEVSKYAIQAKGTSSFDLRDYITIHVKNQMQTQSCWTYPLITGVETNISLTRGYPSPIFSTRHMEYATAKTFLDGINKNGYNREVGSGGNNIIGLSYFTSGLGPVLEKDMPFQNSEEKVNLSEINKLSGQKIEQYIQFPSIYKEITNRRITYKDNKGNILTSSQVNEIRNRIKEHVTTYGGVTAQTNSSQTQYFNNVLPTLSTSYFCDDNNIIQDHVVTIIGWDDNYSKDNFTGACKPSQDGAWLILNSYGTGLNRGYYYISYEDVMVERDMTGLITVADRDYKNLYQYDILAQNIRYEPTLKNAEETKIPVASAYVANVYNRKETTKEYLKEVAITGTGKTQTIDIYINKKGELNLDEAILVASNVRLADEYKTVKLDTPIELTNSKFAVIVKYTHEEQIELGLEANGTVLGLEGSNKWDTATAAEGEGFLSVTGEEGKWQDITQLVETGSLCIKAFTTIEDKTGPTITFETNGSTTYKTEQGSKVMVTDPSGVNESTLRYVWTQSRTQPSITDFETWFENSSVVTKDTETGNNWYLWVIAKDNLGNTSYKRSEAFYLDNTPPTAPTITSNAANDRWTSQTASVTASGSTNLSGIKRYEYSLNDGKDWTPITNRINLTTDGIYRIKTRAIGNTDIEGEESEEYIIKIDKTPPIVTGITEGGLYNYIKPTIQDITTITAKLNKDGVETNYNIDDEGRGQEITQTGNYTLTVTDEVGNKTVVHFTIDAEPPVVTFTPNGNPTYKNSHSTTVHITDAHNIDQSSLKYIWAQNVTTVTENLFNQGAQNFTKGQTITKNDGNGQYALLIMAKDVLGNIALVKSENFALDNTTPKAPRINSNVGNGAITNQAVTITIDGSSSPSGIKTYQYSLDGGNTWIDIAEREELILSETKTYTIIARAINNLNVIGATSQPYEVIINRSVPIITFTPNGSNLYKKEQSTQINVSHSNNLNQESFKYAWSQSESAPSDNIFQEDFYFGSRVTKNTGSGVWYVWAKATDTLGNTAVTRSEAFLLDNSKPTAPNINSNVPNNKVSGQTANVSFDGSQSPSGILKYRYSLDNKVVWNDINENEPISFEQDGTYTIYAYAVNNVKTTGEIAGPYTIKIDKTAPKITGVEEGKKYQEATPIVQDDSEVTIKLIKDGQEIPYLPEQKIQDEGNYTITVTDEAGNETTINFIIDSSGPQITFEPNGNSQWSKTASTMVNITDDNPEGLNSIRYKWVKGTATLTPETFMPDSEEFENGQTITKNTDSGDDWYLWILAKDEQANTSLVRSERFCLDNETPTAPTIRASIPNGAASRQDVTANITGSQSPSGIQKYQYTLDNGITWNDLDSSNTITFDKTGTYSIIARAINYVETIGEPSQSYTITINKEGAIISFEPDGNKNYQKAQQTKITVDSIKPITTLKYLWSTKTQDVTKQEFQTDFTNGQTIEKNTQSGSWYLWILVQDNENNEQIVKSKAFMLDNEIPTMPDMQVNAQPNTTTNKTIELQITGSQSPSGIAKYQYSLNDGQSWIDALIGETVKIDLAGTYQIKARAINNVGTQGIPTDSYQVTLSQSAIKVAFVPNENKTYQKEQSTQVILESKDPIHNLKYLWSTKAQGVQAEEITQEFTNKQTIIKNTDSGTWYLWILATDEKGVKLVQRSGEFNLDNGIPTKPIVIQNKQEEKVILQISGSTALSGIAKYQYSLNNQITWNDLEEGEDLILDEMGEYTLQVRAISNVGIVGEITQTEEIIVRTKIPTILFTPNGNKNYKTEQSTKIDVISSLNIQEDSLKYMWSDQAEGITQEDFMVRSSTVEAFNNGDIITKTGENGIYYVWAYAQNEEGDSKVQRSEAFYFDNSAPTIEGVEDGKTYEEEVTPIIKDNTENIIIKVTKDGEEYDYKLGDTLKENGTYHIVVTDQAGNETKVTFKISIKTNEPTLTEPKPPVDNTIAKDPIPNAGIQTSIFITIVVLIIMAIASFINWKKQKV